MDKKKIVVIGSSNTDMVVKAVRLPVPGETVLGGKFMMNPGGKGANQAVAASRLGGKVTFIGKTGDDVFGNQARKVLEKEGVNINYFFEDSDNPSGIALITVNDKGENCIVVASGSNACLSKSDIDLAKEELMASDIILLQLEIPLDTVLYAAEMGFNSGKKVILNPAPAGNLPDELFGKLYMITPNQTEAEMLTGIKITDVRTAEKAAEQLLSKGTGIVIVTMGSMGALIVMKGKTQLVSSEKVTVMDTTAAGDVFNGALAVAISEGIDIEKAVKFANKAAAISVTRMGAQSSSPYRREIK